MYPDASNLSKMAGGIGLDKEESRKIASDEKKFLQAHEKARNWARKGCSG